MDTQTIDLRLGNGQLLPAWARWSLNLGKQLASQDGERRVVAAVSLPTRSFFSSFAALGAVLHDALTPPSWGEHLEALTDLTPGAPISLAKVINGESYVLPGKWIGLNPQGDRISYHCQGATTSLPVDKCTNVRPLPEGEKSMVNLRRTGLPVEFLKSMLPPDLDPLSFSHVDRLAALVVGTKRVIYSELEGSDVSASGTSGTLSDIVRADTASKESRRSLVISSRKGLTSKQQALTPQLVLFDGATSYLRLGGQWQQSSHLIVIDRTEPSALDAATKFKQRRQKGLGAARAAHLGLPPVPQGLELSAYWVAA